MADQEDWSQLNALIPGAKPAEPAAAGAAPGEDWSKLNALLPNSQRPGVIPTAQPSLLHPLDAISGRSRTEFPDMEEVTPADIRRRNGNSLLGAVINDPQYRQVALGNSVAPTPEAKMAILKSALHLPDSAFSQDQYGNWMVELDGKKGYIDKPGFGAGEFLQLGRDAALAAITRGRSLPGSVGLSALAQRVGTGALMNGAASVGYDATSDLMGGQDGIDPTRAGTAAAFGGAGEMVGPAARAVGRRIGEAFPAVGEAASRVRGLFTPGPPRARAYDEGAFGGMPTEDRRRIEMFLAAPNQDEATLAQASQAARAETSGIPRTLGQSTNDPEQLATEANIRGSAGAPGRIMRDFDRRQVDATEGFIAENRNAISANPVHDGFQGTAPPALGDAVSDGVRSAYATSRQAVDDAYTAIPNTTGLSFTPDRVRTLGHSLLDATQNHVVLPGTRVDSLLRSVEAWGDAPVTLQRIETLRRQIGHAMDGTPDQDYGALSEMKKTLDRWIGDSIDMRGYSGNPDIVDALKTARAENTRHMRAFEPADAPPRVNQMLTRILKEGEGSAQAIDGILGTGTEFGARGVKESVERLIELSPAARPALREAVLNRLLSGTKASDRPSYSEMADRLHDALENRGADVMHTLFEMPEIDRLGLLANELRDVSKRAPSADASHRIEGLLRNVIGGGVLGGLAHGSVSGAAAGVIAGALPSVAKTILDRGAAVRATTAPIGPAASWLNLVPSQQIGRPAAALGGQALDTVLPALPQGAARLFDEPTPVPERRGLF